MMSLKRIWPVSSVRIENVYGSHSTRIWPFSTACPSVTLQARAVGNLIALAVAALVVLNDQMAVAVHHDQFVAALRVRPLDHLQVVELDDALVLRVERRRIRNARRRAADVERAHRQLRARLADGLRGDDADRQTHLDQLAGREVAAVALGAHAAA